MAVTETVPDVTFKTRVRDESVGGDNPYRWEDKTTQEIFGGRKVIVFSLPGAFTPTCSSNHLPRYDELYDEFKKHGIEPISPKVGDKFDPKQHEAMFEAPVPGTTAGEIIQVSAQGFMLHDRILRPAQVGVSSFKA